MEAFSKRRSTHLVWCIEGKYADLFADQVIVLALGTSKIFSRRVLATVFGDRQQELRDAKRYVYEARCGNTTLLMGS